MDNREPVWSVSEVNQAVRELIEGSLMPFWLSGEIGSLVQHRSGHAYFSLKDDKSQLRGCWFGGAERIRQMQIGNGSLVEVYGRLTVYTVRGEYQFSVSKMRPAGLGELQRRFEEVKRKLEAEGLFAPERKRPIPLLPRRIGIITSPSGAAIRDFLQIINRRFPNLNIRIFPALVQGAGAADSVVRGLDFFNRTNGADVLVVTRGGGSMEDLWPFNEERVARAVAASRIPVISAVGHEIDFTICDFAADLRAPTPSAAAELVIGRREEFLTTLRRCEKDIIAVTQLALNRWRHRLDSITASPAFSTPQHLLDLYRQRVDELDGRRDAALELFCSQLTGQLVRLETALNALNPARQLERGYALVFDAATRKPVTTARQPSGKTLNLRFSDGELAVKTQ